MSHEKPFVHLLMKGGYSMNVKWHNWWVMLTILKKKEG